MTSLSSEQTVRDYVQHHPLSRPHVPWLRIVAAVAVAEGLLLSVAVASGLKIGKVMLFADVYHLAILLIWGRQLLCMAVIIYQRYAPEHVRRGCTCMPTCSEYALLTLEKYPWPKALLLIIKRVFVTCDLPGYKTDYP